MKFTGELKFPEIDHPGVPVQFVIEGAQAELLVEGESLGRWSLYDLRARRLVASAFQIELDGTEVTFVADDPIDFAYRGVEHMAETWATLKSKRIASRSIAVRKSRKGTTPSRIEDMKAAMISNLEGQSAPRQLAGEVVMPGSAGVVEEEQDDRDWDLRESGSIPVVGAEPDTVEETPEPAALQPELGEQLEWIEEEKRRLAAEWERLEEERRLAERREEDRIEAYRLEMDRLRTERERLQQQVGTGTEETVGAEEPELEPMEEPEPVAVERPVDEPVVIEPDVEETETEDLEPAVEPEADEPEPVDAEEPVEPEPVDAEEPVEPEPVDAEEPVEPEPEPAVGVVDLNHLEEEPDEEPEHQLEPEPEPVAAAPATTVASAGSGTSRERSGLMGAVRAAFRSGSRDHDHQFIEAPGGIGITRYVCEECGYVSISA